MAAAAPPLRRDAAGVPLPPHEPSFDEPGVSTVFKRFFEPYCELQLLFEETLGAELLAAYEREYPGGAPRWSWGPGGAPAAALERDRRALPLPRPPRQRRSRFTFASDALLGAPAARCRTVAPTRRSFAWRSARRVWAAACSRRRRRTGGCRCTRSRCRGDALASAPPPRPRRERGVQGASGARRPLLRARRDGWPDAPRPADGRQDGLRRHRGGGEGRRRPDGQPPALRHLLRGGALLVFGGDDAQQVHRRRHQDRQLELLPSDALDGLNCTAASTAASRAQRTR